MPGNHGAVQRQTSSSMSTTPFASYQLLDEPKQPTFKRYYDSIRPEFKLVCPINIPSSPESAGVRIIKNLADFAIYYAHFVWIILLITLIPKRKVSLVFLVIMTYVASLYLLILRTFPNSNVLHKIIDKRAVLFLIFVGTVVELAVTGGGLHLLFTLVGSIPVVLLHAVLWIREDDGRARVAEEMGDNGANDESVTIL